MVQLGCGVVLLSRTPVRTFHAPDLRTSIATDADLEITLKMARALLSGGLNAGTGYPEVWIRDLNTFIQVSLEVNRPSLFKEALTNFLLLQGETGDIVDGYVIDGKVQEPAYRRCVDLPGYSAHKNTVESDQESSLVLAVAKLVRQSNDLTFLDLVIDKIIVRERLALALNYLLTERFDPRHGLIWGGSTIDWGDVAPEQYPGTRLLLNSHRAIGIYHNAMLASALREYLLLPGHSRATVSQLTSALVKLKGNIHKHLWDGNRRQFIPHIYLDGSPFPPAFDERSIYFHGGTAVAIEADLLTKNQVRYALDRMRKNVRASGAASIGLTLFPPYPRGYYADPILTKPYTYQNGGDWCWFGGRMVQQLIRFGMVEDAYLELKPMVERVVRTGKFSEWWTPDNQPRGSSNFRGSAGVLGRSIEMLQEWAYKDSDAKSNAS